MTDLDPVWINAYTIRRKRTPIFGLPWFAYVSFEIVFEDRAIAEVEDRDDAGKFIAALNGAYNLGRARQALDQPSCRSR